MTDLSIKCKYASNFFAKAVEDSQGLTMLYRIVPGVCKQSFGCNVARITGFPEHVITDCITYSSQYEFFQSETSNESEKIQQYTENYLARLKRASERSDEDLLSEFNSIKDEMASHELPQFRKTLEVSKMQKNI
ncbi:MAG: MutS-like protein [Marteilia pararefringens]